MASRTDADVRRESIAWCALSKVATKEYSRDHLKPGSEEVKGRFLGKVNGEAVSLPVAGVLQVAEDSTRSTSSHPDHAHVLALFLALVPKPRRAALLAKLPKQFTKNKGELPAADAGLLTEAGQLLKSLRSRTTVPKKGDVHFSRTK